MIANDKTITYYDQHVDEFAASTVDASLSQIQNRFLDKLQKGGLILDFGCGSGRDTKYFLEKGFCVEAIDGSEEICKYASNYTGIQVKKLLFQDLDEINKYDGIWACSSILHLTKIDLKIVFPKMIRALKENGIIYTSFKYSQFEGYRQERYFTDFTLEEFAEFIKEIQDISIDEYWITGDVRPGRGEEKWLNLILLKN